MSDDQEKKLGPSSPPSSALAEPAVTENGARVELRWAHAQCEAEKVVYTARWFFPDHEIDGKVVISRVEGNKSLSYAVQREEKSGSNELPEWLEEFTMSLLRLHARSLKINEAELCALPWPRRLTRWRKAP